MFNIAVQPSTETRTPTFQVVYVDSLGEAELMGLALARRRFGDTPIMLVHRGDLEYDVYEISEPIGSVVIMTG